MTSIHTGQVPVISRNPRLRPGRESERDHLDGICFRAKAHWGYDAAFMESVRDQIRVSAEAMALARVWVAVDAGDRALAVTQVDRLDAVSADLTLMFVAPEAMGQGLGRALFAQAILLAQELRVRDLLIDADPGAVGFYTAMGAERIGATPTGYQGRLLPKFRMLVPRIVR
jgi:GNAT superfamily N-acetyltransferase